MKSRSLADQSSQYPFLNALTPVLENLKELNGKPYPWYLTDFVNQRATLLEMKVSIIDPVRAFMNGPQKAIFDNARQFVQAQEFNFTYIAGDTSAQIQRQFERCGLLQKQSHAGGENTGRDASGAACKAG